jgi:O-antigen ligase
VMQQIDTRLLVDTTRSSTLPKKVIRLLVQARTSPKIVRWTFSLFVFAIPFETIDLGAIPLWRLAGFLFFSTCLFYPKVCFRRPLPALWWFAGYASVLGLSGLSLPEQFGDLSIVPFIARFKIIIQLLVFCWIGSTLLQEEKFARHTLLAFSIATLLAATGMLLALPGFVAVGKEGRLTIQGHNADGAALLMALGAHALIGFGIGIEQTRRNIWMRVTFLAMSLFPITAMVYTGARGGVISFLAGVALYILPYCGSKRKMAAILGASILVVGVVYNVVNNQNVLSRFERSYNTGETAGRDRIYVASIEMISEKPLLGWGYGILLYELGPRGYGTKMVDPHNLFLYLLLEVGLLGTIPFLMGLGLCIRAAWTARVSSLGPFPLAWLVTMLVESMIGTTLASNLLWLVLIVSLAAGASTIKQYKRKNLMIRTILRLGDAHEVHDYRIKSKGF